MPFVFLDRETERQFAETDGLTDNLWTDFAAAETIHECNGLFSWDKEVCDEEREMAYELHQPRPVSEYELELAWETRKKPVL